MSLSGNSQFRAEFRAEFRLLGANWDPRFAPYIRDSRYSGLCKNLAWERIKIDGIIICFYWKGRDSSIICGDTSTTNALEISIARTLQNPAKHLPMIDILGRLFLVLPFSFLEVCSRCEVHCTFYYRYEKSDVFACFFKDTAFM